jgi:hypothetical protein
MQKEQEDHAALQRAYNSLLATDPFPAEEPPASPRPAHGRWGWPSTEVVAWMASPAVIGPICSRCRCHPESRTLVSVTGEARLAWRFHMLINGILQTGRPDTPENR